MSMFLVAAAATPTPTCPPPCEALRARVRGAFVCGAADVANYSFGWGNRICEGIRPACVLRPHNASDVSAAVRVAAETSTPLSYRSGGHSYTCNSIKPDSIHVDLRSLDEVKLQRSRFWNGTEIVAGTGTIMRELVDVLGPGQTIVHGQCPTVGTGGLFLHGGYHTTLTIDYGRGNDTVTWMEVVTAEGAIVELSDASPHGDLWSAMRQAGSSFGIATRIAAKVFDVPPSRPTDGGDFFALDVPRTRLLELMDDAARERPGLPNYIHVNGVDFLIASASRDFGENAAWLEGVLGRKLSAKEWLRSKMVAELQPAVSTAAGGADARFGSSGAIPYLFSSQEAFATVSFIMPIGCYKLPRMRALLAAVPEHRDNATDLGCYFQVTSTYWPGFVFVDYNCAYDSPYYMARQRQLNAEVMQLCPAGMRRYYNTPSAFLKPSEYFPNYPELAAIKAKWDPNETFRVYQGIRPTGLPPDDYEFTRPSFVRQRSAADWVGEAGWDALKRFGILRRRS